jgi:hypothetical protein
MRIAFCVLVSLVWMGCAQGGGLPPSSTGDSGTGNNNNELPDGGWDNGGGGGGNNPDPSSPECQKVNSAITLCAGIPQDQLNNCVSSGSPLFECMKASNAWCTSQTVVTDTFDGGAGLLSFAQNNTAVVVCLTAGNVLTKTSATLEQLSLTNDSLKTRVAQNAIWNHCKRDFPPASSDKSIGAAFGPIGDAATDGKVEFFCSANNLASAENYWTSVYASTVGNAALTQYCDFSESGSGTPPPSALTCSFAVHAACVAGFGGDRFLSGYGPLAWDETATAQGTVKQWRILCFR